MNKDADSTGNKTVASQFPRSDSKAYVFDAKRLDERREDQNTLDTVKMETREPNGSSLDGKNIPNAHNLAQSQSEQRRRKEQERLFLRIARADLNEWIKALEQRIADLTRQLAEAEARHKEASDRYDRLYEQSEALDDLQEAVEKDGWTLTNRKAFEELTGTAPSSLTPAELDLLLTASHNTTLLEMDKAYDDVQTAASDIATINAELSLRKQQLSQAMTLDKELSNDDHSPAPHVVADVEAITAEIQSLQQTNSENQMSLGGLRESVFKTTQFETTIEAEQKSGGAPKFSF